MKKSLLLFVCILLIISAFSYAYAGQIYEIPELNLTYVLPQNWIQFSQNESYNYEAADAMGISLEQTTDFVSNNEGLFLIAADKNFNDMIYIIMQDNETLASFTSLNALSRRQIKNFADDVVDYFQFGSGLNYSFTQSNASTPLGYEIYAYDILEMNDIKYIRFKSRYTYNSEEHYGIIFITVQNGQMITINLSPLTAGKIPTEINNTLNDFVGGIHFTELAEGKRPIDTYTVFMAFLVVIIIAAVMYLAVSEIAKRKQKKDDFIYETQIKPKNSDSVTTHSGTLD